MGDLGHGIQLGPCLGHEPAGFQERKTLLGEAGGEQALQEVPLVGRRGKLVPGFPSQGKIPDGVVIAGDQPGSLAERYPAGVGVRNEGERSCPKIGVQVEPVDENVSPRVVQKALDAERAPMAEARRGLDAAKNQPVVAALHGGVLQGEAGELQVIESLCQGDEGGVGCHVQGTGVADAEKSVEGGVAADEIGNVLFLSNEQGHRS